MIDYPKGTVARQAIRDRLKRRELAEAERRTLRAGRSIMCGENGNHAPHGCRNDGSCCLCECHDVSADAP